MLISRKKRQKRWDFKPISVLNTSLKIILKVLANRLGRFCEILLGDIVEDHQTGVLKGRNILYSIATAQDTLHFTKRNKTRGFMLKLDFKKTYNTVE